MPVKKGLSKGAKIGIAAAGILTLGTVAALIAWGVKSKGNKEPEDTEPNIKGPNNEEQNIESNENGSEKENKNDNKPEGNIIVEKKIVEKKQEQSKFFNVLQKTFDSENNKFVRQKIQSDFFNMGEHVLLSWTPAEVFSKMFKAIADKNSGFLEYYRFKKKENNDEYEKLISMISGNIEFDEIQVEEITEGLGFKKYCLTIYKENMKEWMKFTISNANFLNNYDSIANIEIQLCERLDKKGKVIKKCECISIDSLMNEGKFKGISED